MARIRDHRVLAATELVRLFGARARPSRIAARRERL
jgi:hypothetical protein